MNWLKPTTLDGRYCKLEPLTVEHHDDLIESVNDGQLWNLWYTPIPKPDEMNKEIRRRLLLQEQGLMLPFVTIDKPSGKAIGMTSFLNLDPTNLRVEIGGTWNRRTAQKTPINTESKLLLLKYAFETLNCNAVEFRTHFCNHQSRKSIERLGAKLDGILRNHMVMPDGTLRDTCVYSILLNEWSTIKKHLEWLINMPRQSF